MTGFFSFLKDRGEDWVRWMPDMPDADEIRAAIERFEPVDLPAGERAARWLREEALDNHPSTVTHVMVREERVEAFFALCSSQAKLSQSHRKRVMSGEREHELLPVQPVALIAWLAKDRRAATPGIEILAQAAAAALEVIEVGQGQIALALNPFDDETAQFWRERYGFRRSQSIDGRSCLWRTLMKPRPETN